MAGTGKAKAKSDSLEAEQELRQEVELRQEERHTSERIEQQDLNQGMDTGTHSPWVSRLLTLLGHEVIVAHAQKVQLIVSVRLTHLFREPCLW